MKNLFKYISLFIITLVISSVTASADTFTPLDFHKGSAVYEAKNYKEAAKWFRLAADQGYADDTVKTARELFNEKYGVPDSAEKVADKEKYDRIYNACLLDKGLEFDMQIEGIRNAVYGTCASIADDPSWLENFKYN